MKYWTNIILTIIILLSFLSCTSDIIEPPPEDELLDFAYSGNQYPDGFYTEELSGGTIYYENTISTTPLNERGDEWIQFCADDIETARELSERSGENCSTYREPVSERETEKYYEFRKVNPNHPSDIVLSRIHKCSYLDRSMYDFLNTQEVIGVFTKINFNIEDARELIEYLWFTQYSLLGCKVYKSSIKDNRGVYIQTIYEVRLIKGDWGVTDRIEYIENIFYVNKINGEITYQSKIIKQIQGKNN